MARFKFAEDGDKAETKPHVPHETSVQAPKHVSHIWGLPEIIPKWMVDNGNFY